jgi:uncharacterized protein YcfJ
MRRLLAAIPAMTLLTACSTVPTSPAEPVYMDTAEVIQAEPLYQPVQVARPVRECWTETVPHASPRRSSYAGPIAGGIIGGVIGSKLGRGWGNAPLAVAGALVGASIGERLSTPAYAYGPTTWSNVQRCRTVNQYEQRQQVVGYRVDYRYEGQTFTTRTQRHPGRYIRVRVDVDPVDGT